MTRTQQDVGESPIEAAPQAHRPSASLRAVGLVSVLTVVQLLLQFGTQLLQAQYFGTAGEMDAYVAALAMPLVIAAMISGALGYVLVPVIAEALTHHRQDDAATIARQVGGGLTVLSLAITSFVAVLADSIAALLCPGFSPSERALTAGLLRVLSLLIVANCLAAFLNALYHSYGQFTRPAVSGVVGTSVMLAWVWLLHVQQGIYAVAWGAVAGTFTTVGILLPLFAAQYGRSYLPRWCLHAGTRRCLTLLTPLVVGALFWRLDPLLDRFLGSFLETGRIAQMGYAARLVNGLMLIGTSGLSIVAFPAIAAHAAAGRSKDLNAEVAHALRFFLFLMLPVGVGVGVFSLPIVRLLFEHGKFSGADSEAVALLLVLSTGVILGAGLGDLLSRTSYAQQDVHTPVLVSIAAFAVAAVVKCLVVRPWGAPGIVAATSFYSLLNVVLLGAILRHRLSAEMLAGTAGTTIRALLASTAACLGAAFVVDLPSRWAVLPAAALGAVIYFTVMWCLNDEFARRINRMRLAKRAADGASR